MLEKLKIVKEVISTFIEKMPMAIHIWLGITRLYMADTGTFKMNMLI